MRVLTFRGGYDTNFCYLVIDEKEALVIDPSVPAHFVLDRAKEEGVKILACVVMHSHGDHIVELEAYREEKIPLYAHSSMKVPVDKILEEGDSIAFGSSSFTVMHTPGHRFDCICLYAEGHLFSSDTLFVHGVGRIDFQGSDPELMLKTLERLKSLPDATIVYPGHDYGPTKRSTIGEEKKENPFLSMSREEFFDNRLP